MGSKFANLKKVILDNSESKTWPEAVKEWKITGYSEDTKVSSTCTCGKYGLRYLYQIGNTKNGNSVYPIGSCCIRKFQRDDLSYEINVIEERIRLSHAIDRGEFIDIRMFSRKLLRDLWEDGAFPPNKYNGLDGYNDYQFLLDMFNKRSAFTPRQQRKIDAVILGSIKPYLSRTLKLMDSGLLTRSDETGL